MPTLPYSLDVPGGSGDTNGVADIIVYVGTAPVYNATGAPDGLGWYLMGTGAFSRLGWRTDFPADFHGAIDTGAVALQVDYVTSSNPGDSDYYKSRIAFFDENDVPTGSLASNVADDPNTWSSRQITENIPRGSRYAIIEFRGDRSGTGNLSIYFTDIEATLIERGDGKRELSVFTVNPNDTSGWTVDPPSKPVVTRVVGDWQYPALTMQVDPGNSTTWTAERIEPVPTASISSIDAGNATMRTSYFINCDAGGGAGDQIRLTIDFLDASNVVLGTWQNPEGVFNPGYNPVQYVETAAIPVGTRSMRFEIYGYDPSDPDAEPFVTAWDTTIETAFSGSLFGTVGMFMGQSVRPPDSIPGPDLGPLTLYDNRAQEGVAFSTDILGKTALSTITLLDDLGGKYSIVNGDELHGTGLLEGTDNLTLIETLHGSLNSPRNSAVSVVVQLAPVDPLDDLEVTPSPATEVIGWGTRNPTKTTTRINGEFASATVTAGEGPFTYAWSYENVQYRLYTDTPGAYKPAPNNPTLYPSDDDCYASVNFLYTVEEYRFTLKCLVTDTRTGQTVLVSWLYRILQEQDFSGYGSGSGGADL